MTRVKVLVIVTNDRLREQLLATWHDLMVAQADSAVQQGPDAGHATGPVGFGRIDVREGLALYVFVVDGGWRREYICQALAPDCSGYCLVVGPDPLDLALGRDLLALLEDSEAPRGIVGVAGWQEAKAARSVLGVPADSVVTQVDCGSRDSVNELLCVLLEQSAATPVAQLT